MNFFTDWSIFPCGLQFHSPPHWSSIEWKSRTPRTAVAQAFLRKEECASTLPSRWRCEPLGVLLHSTNFKFPVWKVLHRRTCPSSFLQVLKCLLLCTLKRSQEIIYICFFLQKAKTYLEGKTFTLPEAPCEKRCRQHVWLSVLEADRRRWQRSPQIPPPLSVKQEVELTPNTAMRRLWMLQRPRLFQRWCGPRC